MLLSGYQFTKDCLIARLHTLFQQNVPPSICQNGVGGGGWAYSSAARVPRTDAPEVDAQCSVAWAKTRASSGSTYPRDPLFTREQNLANGF